MHQLSDMRILSKVGLYFVYMMVNADCGLDWIAVCQWV